jgi:hypothetical protein
VELVPSIGQNESHSSAAPRATLTRSAIPAGSLMAELTHRQSGHPCRLDWSLYPLHTSSTSTLPYLQASCRPYKTSCSRSSRQSESLLLVAVYLPFPFSAPSLHCLTTDESGSPAALKKTARNHTSLFYNPFLRMTHLSRSSSTSSPSGITSPSLLQ